MWKLTLVPAPAAGEATLTTPLPEPLRLTSSEDVPENERSLALLIELTLPLLDQARVPFSKPYCAGSPGPAASGCEVGMVSAVAASGACVLLRPAAMASPPAFRNAPARLFMNGCPSL